MTGERLALLSPARAAGPPRPSTGPEIPGSTPTSQQRMPSASSVAANKGIITHFAATNALRRICCCKHGDYHSLRSRECPPPHLLLQTRGLSPTSQQRMPSASSVAANKGIITHFAATNALRRICCCKHGVQGHRRPRGSPQPSDDAELRSPFGDARVSCNGAAGPIHRSDTWELSADPCVFRTGCLPLKGPLLSLHLHHRPVTFSLQI